MPITGENAKRVLFGAINVRTAHHVVLAREHAGGADARAFFVELRRRYRRADTIWLVLDGASAHTAAASRALAAPCGSSWCGCPSRRPNSVRWTNSGKS